MKDLFDSSDNQYLVPPYFSDKAHLIESVWKERDLGEHFFLLSSGTTSNNFIKSFAISRDSIVANAKAVNDRFQITKEDRWLSSLPKYHIGGVSIFARAYLSQSEVIEKYAKWNPEILVKTIQSENIQYLSLVPTQLFDLVKLNAQAPETLKGVFIGGDFASQSLCEAAHRLGWPLLMTFGMSELSSQIATSRFEEMEEGFLEVYPIHQLTPFDSKIRISSPALFTEKIEFALEGEIRIESSRDFMLPDQIELISKDRRQFLKPLGRLDDVFKVSGRLYHLNQLRDLLAQDLIKLNLLDKVHLAIIPDARLGKKIKLSYLNSAHQSLEDLKNAIINKLSIPIEHFSFEPTEAFSKTSLGKIKQQQ